MLSTWWLNFGRISHGFDFFPSMKVVPSGELANFQNLRNLLITLKPWKMWPKFDRLFALKIFEIYLLLKA